MIQLNPHYFGWGGIRWLEGDEYEHDFQILEQLYAQMMGWA